MKEAGPMINISEIAAKTEAMFGNEKKTTQQHHAC